MQENFKNLLKRLSNVGTIVGITSAVIFILQSLGLIFDADKVGNVVQGICTIGILLGVLNNSETKGLYVPFIYRYEDLEKDKEVK